MKLMLLTLTTLALLATTGCFFRGDRGHTDDRGRQQYAHHDDPPMGVDHGEFPGDRDHADIR